MNMKASLKSLGVNSVVFGLFVVLPLWNMSLRSSLAVAIALALCAMGMFLLLRAGQVSFGHALYFACGAYTAAALSRATQWDVLWVMVASAVSSAVLGALLGLILARYRGIFYGMLNLAFSMVGFSLLFKLYELTGGSDGLGVRQLPLLGMSLEAREFAWWFYGVALVMLCGAYRLCVQYLNSPVGAALRAIKTNETRLEYMGLSAYRVFYSGHVVSAMLCGLGGFVVAFSTGHVTPELAYWALSAEFVFIAVLGGMGHLRGAVLGALVFELMRAAVSAYAVNAWQLMMGLLLLGMVMFAPGGIWSLLEKKQRTVKGEQA